MAARATTAASSWPAARVESNVAGAAVAAALAVRAAGAAGAADADIPEPVEEGAAEV